MRGVVALVVLAIVAGGMFLGLASAQGDSYEGLRGGGSSGGGSSSGNQTTTFQEPPPQSQQNATPPPTTTNATTPVTQEAAPTGLEADIWAETWFRRAVGIHKVLPDGERESASKFSRMFYNFSILVYAKDSAQPFRYEVRVNGFLVNEGTTTWQLEWITSVTDRAFNVTVDVYQGDLHKQARWDFVIGVPGVDAPIGEKTPDEDGGPTVTLTEQALAWLEWKNLLASIGMMVAAFVVVGGWFSEREEWVGWEQVI